MLIAEGEVAGQVAEKLGRSSAWMTKTARRYNEGGVDALRNKSKNSRSKTLTSEQIKELAELIESGKTKSGGLWSGAQIKGWVKEQTGKEIHKTTAWRMFAKLEFSRRFRARRTRQRQVNWNKRSSKKVKRQGFRNKTLESASGSSVME